MSAWTPSRRRAIAALGVIGVSAAVSLAWPTVDAPSLEADAAGPSEGPEDAARAGKWRRARAGAPSPEQVAEMKALEAIGYVDGAEAVAAPTSITVNTPAAAAGYNLWCSGHTAEAYLTRLDGVVVHTWRVGWKTAFPQSKLRQGEPGTNHFRRVKPLSGGGLFVIFEGRGAVALDRDSRVRWALDNRAHHDAVVRDDGTLLLLTRTAELVPELDPVKPLLLDDIVTLGPGGEERSRLSLLDALMQSEHRALLEGRTHHGDVFHTNSIAELDGRAAGVDPAFAKGNLLLSLRNLDALVVVDPKAQRVVWSARGDFRKQHDAQIVAPDRLTLFDNEGPAEGSRGLTLHLPDLVPVASWGGVPGEPLDSSTLGTMQTLGNGHRLITESDGGRAVEVAEDGRVVWEMFNPHRAGDQGQWIAALFEVRRLSQAEVDAWGALPSAR